MMSLPRVLALLLTACLTTLLFVVACQPPSSGGHDLMPDKVQHALAFGIAVLPVSLTAGRRTLLLTCLALLGVGILIEIVQPWFGRDRSPYDVLADIVGIALGAMAGRAARRLWRRQA